MKNKLLKGLMASFALAVSGFANAGLISANGYSWDTSEDSFSNGSLEWLRLTETVGLSVNEALAANAGYRVATSSELYQLYDDWFTNGSIPASPADVSFNSAYGAGEELVDWFGCITQCDYAFSNWSHYDGSTLHSAEYDFSDLVSSSYLLFELDNGYYGYSNINDDRAYTYTSTYGSTVSTNNYQYGQQAYTEVHTSYNTDFKNATWGVALVRDVTSVPEPSTLAVFALGLMGLASRKFKKQA